MDKPTIIKTFTGGLDMSNVLGAFYEPHIQAANISFTLANAVPGGRANISIVADGAHTITIPAGWIKLGGNNIGTVAGQINHLKVVYCSADKILYYNKVEGSNGPVIQLACSDESTPLSLGNGKLTFRMPYAMSLSSIRASLTTAQASGTILTIDVNKNGVSILSTKLTIDNTEKTSVTAAIPPVITTQALDDDAEITIDIDQVGDGTATGLKLALIGS